MLKLPDRKEREEVARLKTELREIGDEHTRKDQKARAAIDRLRRQLASEATEKMELQKELRLVSMHASSAHTHRHAAPTTQDGSATPMTLASPASRAPHAIDEDRARRSHEYDANRYDGLPALHQEGRDTPRQARAGCLFHTRFS